MNTAMEPEFEEYRARRLVNVHRHVDGPWFWTRYSAHPYVGCRSGCEFCYLRGGRYLGRRSPDSFDTLIQVKTNVIERLRAELPPLPRDVLALGDWQQPAEERYRLSRAMLEVALELEFPVFIVERSPLLARDVDLLIELSRRTWVGVVVSYSNVDPELKRAFEPRSPGIKQRLQMMAELAGAGILVGASLMPIIPFVGDDEAHLDEAVRATADHGGRFVLAAGMTMDGVQAVRTLAAADTVDPTLRGRWLQLYGEDEGKPRSSPPREYQAQLGLRAQALCERYGLLSRMPRYIPPGPLGINKRVAEQQFLKAWALDLELGDPRRVWAYRKAAWTVDEWPESVAALAGERGAAGLRALPGIGDSISRFIFDWLANFEG